MTQIAASFVLLAGASMLLKTLLALQAAQTGFDTRHVLAINVPVMSYGRTPDQIVGFYKETIRRITELPGVDRVAVGTAVPWRDAGSFGPGFEFSGGRPRPRTGRRRSARAVPDGLARIFRGARRPIIAGRDFNDADRRGGEAGRHREPEPGAADVPESGCGQPPHDVDRSGDEVHRRQHRARGASSASRPMWTTRTWCRARR